MDAFQTSILKYMADLTKEINGIKQDLNSIKSDIETIKQEHDELIKVIHNHKKKKWFFN